MWALQEFSARNCEMVTRKMASRNLCASDKRRSSFTSSGFSSLWRSLKRILFENQKCWILKKIEFFEILFRKIGNIVQTLGGYLGWWHNVWRWPMPSFIQECDRTSHNIDQVDFGLMWSNSWSLGTLKALRHHLKHRFGFTQHLH